MDSAQVAPVVFSDTTAKSSPMAGRLVLDLLTRDLRIQVDHVGPCGGILFHLFLAYELALLYDERRELEAATRFYQVVLDAPRPRRSAAAIEAERKARYAENRLLLIASERRHARDRTTIVVLLLVLLVVGFVFVLRRRPSLKSAIDHTSNGVFIPRNMPAGLSLEELKVRFQTIPNVTELVARRLAYI